MKRASMGAAAAAVLLSAACALAGQTDNLYSLETKANPGEVAQGSKGQIEIKIRTKPGAHISDEAPVKITLAGKNVKLDKQQLTKADATKQEDGPKFEVPFVAESKGAGAVDADMTFFVCTDKICERQAKKVSIPVSVK